MIEYMKMLIIKMYRDILMIAEYFVNKVSLCLCGRSFFGVSEKLLQGLYWVCLLKEECSQNTRMKMQEPVPTFSCNIHPSG